jgi:phosphatidyl-myo-inositol dimannoside synthase
MINLLIFAMRFPPEKVGTALYAANLAEGLSERGVQVTVLAPEYGRGQGPDDAATYPVRRIKGGHHPFPPLRYPLARAALGEAVHELEPDALWATNGMATRVAGTMLGQLEMPLIGSLHGTDIATRLPGRSPRTWIESIPQRAFYRRAECLVTNSNFTLNMALQKGIDRDRLRLAYLGIDLPEDWESMRQSALRMLPDLANRRVVLTVGRLVKQKGHRVLINAMQQLLHADPEVLHVIVGDGPETNALRAHIEKLGLSERVILVGRVSDAELQAYYALASVFALTSHAVDSRVEGLGFVFLEAAARGLVAVGSRHGGIPEAIVDGETGFLVDPERPDEIAARIGRLLCDGDLCRSMGNRARRHIEEQFGVGRMMDECFDILTTVSR